MVEFVLISIAAVAILLFTMNLRNTGLGREPGRLLDGSPRWVEGHVVSVTPRGTCIGMTSAELVVDLGGQRHELVGLLPTTHEHEIVAGISVSGHVEYDLLDTLRTHLWDGETEAVLRECCDRFGGELDSHDETFWFTVDLTDEDHLWVSLADDGWFNVEVPAQTGLDDDRFLDIRSSWLPETDAPLYQLGDKLAVSDVDDSTPFIASLSPYAIQRMEDFTEATDGWITASEAGLEFECGLPFAEPSLIIALVNEFRDLCANLSTDEPDGQW